MLPEAWHTSSLLDPRIVVAGALEPATTMRSGQRIVGTDR
jgi:hypothetical protein